MEGETRERKINKQERRLSETGGRGGRNRKRIMKARSKRERNEGEEGEEKKNGRRREDLSEMEGRKKITGRGEKRGREDKKED